jgi:mannose-6-phosphate isomerase-like protein (cupin superfamily)
MRPIDLNQKLAIFQDHWNPRIIARLNGQAVKVVKFVGEFVWHKHDHEDELFMVLEGTMRMDFRDRSETVESGQIIVVPRGVEHRPCAVGGECSVMLFEPETTLNTGDAEDARRRDTPEAI